MYNALSVAHYVIDYCNSINIGISNLKLQKILYFIQAEFLVSTPTHSPCFSDPIEAWDFGPVVPSVYHQYKIYGGSIIPSNSNDPLLPYYQEIQPEDKALMDNMINATANYSASQLVELTHKQSPWRSTYRKGFNNLIPNILIRNFFEADQ